MVFSSLLFIFVFLPITLTVFYVVVFVTRSNKNGINIFLAILSLNFYFWSSGKMILLLIASILLNWFIGGQFSRLNSNSNRKYLLIFGIALNLAALLWFKYCRFILDFLSVFVGTVIAPDVHPYFPVGISFYTFMAISYLMEVYRSPCLQASLLEFGTYLSLFPHLVAGPIVRFSELAKDLRQRTSLTISNFYKGIIRFIQGLGMKVLLADNLSTTVDQIFSLHGSELTFKLAWIGSISYTFQIYFDFAGYSAMAIGLASMIGFNFPENFNRPYIAPTMTEFWKRWHMTLTRWLRDYIYIPLGGNRKGNLRTYINLFTVFFICGLWHGARWTFVAWGVYHGLLLIYERFMRNNFDYTQAGFIGTGITFFLTIIGWVVFRSESFDQCWFFLNTMFSINNLEFTNFQDQLNGRVHMDNLFWFSLGGAMIFSFFPLDSVISRIIRVKPRLFDGVTYLIMESVIMANLLILTLLYVVGHSYKPFIYFRF